MVAPALAKFGTAAFKVLRKTGMKTAAAARYGTKHPGKLAKRVVRKTWKGVTGPVGTTAVIGSAFIPPAKPKTIPRSKGFAPHSGYSPTMKL